MTGPQALLPPRLPVYANVAAVAAVGLAVTLTVSPPTQLLIVLPVLFASMAVRRITARRFRARAGAGGGAERQAHGRRGPVLAVFAASMPLFLIGLVRPGLLAVWYAAVTVAVVEIRRAQGARTGHPPAA